MFVFREEYYLNNREPAPDTPEHAAWMSDMERAHGRAESSSASSGMVRPARSTRFRRRNDAVFEFRPRRDSSRAHVNGHGPQPWAAVPATGTGDPHHRPRRTRRQLAALAERVAPARCAAVVKADAYGIGIEAAVPALAAAGCTVFFVAHPGEGRRVRACLAGRPNIEIYVLNGLLPGRDYLATYLRTTFGRCSVRPPSSTSG